MGGSTFGMTSFSDATLEEVGEAGEARMAHAASQGAAARHVPVNRDLIFVVVRSDKGQILERTLLMKNSEFRFSD